MPGPTRSPSQRSRPPKRGRRWVRRVVYGFMGCGMALVVGAVVFTQTGMLRGVVLGQIESRLGCEATASSVRLTLGGELILRDLTLRLPQLEGVAAEAVVADEVRAFVDWGSLVAGRNPLRSVVVADSLVRVSLDEQTSVVNLSLLRPPPGSGVMTGYPRIDLLNTRIELGEHRAAGDPRGAQYTQLTTLDLQGQLVESQDISGLYEVELRQLVGERAGEPQATRLRGTIERETGEVVLTLTGLDLAEWSSRTAPSRIRGFWQALDVRGAIDDATFTYAPNEGLAVLLTPRDVDLLVPITVPDAREADGSRTEMLAMQDVRGSIVFAENGFSADLAGTIEQLDCRVNLQYDSYSFESSYRAQIETDRFSFEDQDSLRRFAPPMVFRVLNRFVDPAADLSGFVRISRARGADGSPGRVSTQGIVNIQNGSGRFGMYPYPVGDISGRVRFSDAAVELIDIKGESASGARLSASGRIWPPRDGAAVEIDVRVRDLAMDELFMDSLPDHRRPVFETIFNREHYDRLRALGEFQSVRDRLELVNERVAVQGRLDALAGRADASTVEVETLRRRLVAIDEIMGRPVFELGGVADLNIAIRREQGDDTQYTEHITIEIPDAGVIVDRFAYPVTADRLRVEIGGGEARIPPTMLRGLRGGGGSIEGAVQYGSDRSYEPNIRIVASDIPIDSMLVQALPGRTRFENRAAENRPAGDGEAGFSVHRFLRRLNLVGTASCSAHIFAGEGGETDFLVDVEFDGVAAHPIDAVAMNDAELLRFKPGAAHGEPALLSGLSGALRVTDNRLDMERLEGIVEPVGAEGEGASFSGRVAVSFPRRAGESEDGARVTESIDVELSGLGIAIEQPLERVLDAADARRARVVADLRERFQPAGVLDARLTLRGNESDLRFEVLTDRVRHVSFDALGGRAEVRSPTGHIEVVPERVSLRGIEGELLFEGHSSGELRVDGAYSLSAMGIGAGGDEVLRGEVKEARFEAPMLAAVAGEFAPGAGERIRELGLSGVFDAGFTVRSGGEEDGLEAQIRPVEIAIERNGVSTRFNPVSGVLAVSEAGGPIELELHAPSMHASVRGLWTRSPEHPFLLDAEIEASASSLHDGVFGLLPSGVVSLLKGLEAESDSQMTLGDARLLMDADGAVRFSGSVDFESLALRVGLRLEEMLGTARVRAVLVDGLPADVEVDLTGSRASASGAVLTDIAARVETGERSIRAVEGRASDAPGTVYVPVVSASVAGGRVAARGTLRPSGETGTLERGAWQVEADLSGLDFGRLLGEVSRDPQRVARAPENRGLLDANLSLTGVLGDVGRQRGRALLRVQPAPGRDGTEVLRLPGLIEFVKLSSLQAPVSEPIDFAYAEAFIEGSIVNVHELSAESRSVSINGSGTMTLPELKLDLTFTTIVLRDVSLLAEIFERVRNELVTARITGTLYDPQVEVEQLTATRRLIDAIIRGEQSPPSP